MNSLERFRLHQQWFIAKSKKDGAAMREIERKLDKHDLYPETFTASPSELLSELMDVENLRLKHQYYLSRISNYTLIGPKIPGGLSETSVSLLRRSKGRGRKGQSGGNNSNVNDLANNEEVKEAARMFNQIDLVLEGEIVAVGRRQWLKINEADSDPRFVNQVNGKEKRVVNQLSSNVSSIQSLEIGKEGTLCPIPGDIAKTVSTTSHTWHDKTATKKELIREGLWDIAKTAKGNLYEPASLRNALVANSKKSRDKWILKHMKKVAGISPHGIDVQRIVLKVENGVVLGWDRIEMNWVETKPWPWHGYAGAVKPADGLYFQLTDKTKFQIKSTDATHFRICMERAHFNLGNKKPAGFRSMVESGINFVSRHIDAAGRPAIAFCYLKLEPAKAKKLIAKAQKLETEKYQWQPYLFADNTRSELHTGNNSLKDMGAKLLLYMVETKPGKYEKIYSASDVNSAKLIKTQKIEKILCEVDSKVRFPLRHHDKCVDDKGCEFDYTDNDHRKSLLLHHCKKIAAYSRKMRKWTDLTNTARSVLSGKDGEQLAALYSGLKGDRSMARGDDLIEKDNSPSEVKHISGAKGDAAFTIDPSGTIHLGGPGDITSQKRLFVSWMEDRGVPGNSKLHMKLLVTDSALKSVLDAQHDVYYNNRQVSRRAARDLDANAQYKPDLQYHSQPYSTSKIGKGNRSAMPENGVLDFSKNIAFEYIEGKDDFSEYTETLIDF